MIETMIRIELTGRATDAIATLVARSLGVPIVLKDARSETSEPIVVELARGSEPLVHVVRPLRALDRELFPGMMAPIVLTTGKTVEARFSVVSRQKLSQEQVAKRLTPFIDRIAQIERIDRRAVHTS